MYEFLQKGAESRVAMTSTTPVGQHTCPQNGQKVCSGSLLVKDPLWKGLLLLLAWSSKHRTGVSSAGASGLVRRVEFAKAGCV